MMNLLRIFFAFAVWSPLFAASQPSTLDVGSLLDQRVAIWQSLQTIADPDGSLTPAKASSKMLAAASQGLAERLSHADAPLGKGILHPYWAKFALSNSSAETQNWLFSFESPTQDSVVLWRSAPQAWQLIDQIDANRTAFGSGELFPLWRISLKPGEAISFLMRIDGYNRMRFPVVLMQDEVFVQQQRMLASGIGFFMAIPLIVLLYVLTLMRIAGDKSVVMFAIMALGEWVGAS